jgi:putative SOS response-associated peptidase YedK
MKRSSCACSSVVEKADWPLWLGEADGDVMGLPRSAPEDALRFWRVDKKIRNVRNDGPEPVVPAEAALL